jgi:Xaa-Pro aminopeptidase
MDIRREKLMKSMEESGVDALLITKAVNQRYLEGFTGNDCYLLASAKGNFLMADSRYTEMARRECAGAAVIPHRHPHPPLNKVLAGIAGENGFRRIGFESEDVTFSLYSSLSEALRGVNAEMIPLASVVEKIRARKDRGEIDSISAACRAADGALHKLLEKISGGVSELDIKVELDYLLKTGGADDVSFDTMVLFGARASQPHANSSRDVTLGRGDFILIDYGAAVDGYRSDTTRTFVFGTASSEQKRAYNAVRRAQAESLAMVKSGANGREINDTALRIITGDGFPAFDYGIGHGVGLAIHEEPFLRQNTDVTLESAMVFTIEPGTYIPGWGGIRIEDTVLVKAGGNEVLTSFPKELIEL